MPKKRTSRIYWRNHGGVPRAYADFRDFADVGGAQQRLVAKGEKLATADPDVAASLVAARLTELESERRGRALLGAAGSTTLAEFAAKHLKTKSAQRVVEPGWLKQEQKHLAAAIEFFDQLTPEMDERLGHVAGADRPLESIGVAHAKAYKTHLAERTSKRKHGGGTPIAPGTQRKYLNSLGNLFANAIEDELYEKANPVHALRDKPTDAPHDAAWLEVWEGALLLESARTFPYHAPLDSVGSRLARTIAERFGAGEAGLAAFASRMAQGGEGARDQVAGYVRGERIPAAGYLQSAGRVLGADDGWLRRGAPGALRSRPDPIIYPLLATWLLTGGREEEVTGLEVSDVHFGRGVIEFRPNMWRGAGRSRGPRLKTRGSRRAVPLWPQLRAILEEYLERRPKGGSLLFPSPRLALQGKEGIISDARKALDAVAVRVEWKSGDIRSRIFRHTYISTRLQTLDGTAPVQPWTVAREVGHKDLNLINHIYGHVQRVRQRLEFVEYRIENFEELEDVRRRLRPLRIA